jgi:hypothetical protein
LEQFFRQCTSEEADAVMHHFAPHVAMSLRRTLADADVEVRSSSRSLFIEMWRQWQPVGDALLAELPEATRKQILSDKRSGGVSSTSRASTTKPRVAVARR